MLYPQSMPLCSSYIHLCIHLRILHRIFPTSRNCISQRTNRRFIWKDKVQTSDFKRYSLAGEKVKLDLERLQRLLSDLRDLNSLNKNSFCTGDKLYSNWTIVPTILLHQLPTNTPMLQISSEILEDLIARRKNIIIAQLKTEFNLEV